MYLLQRKEKKTALNIEQDAEGGLLDLAANSAKLVVSTALTPNTDDLMASVQMKGSKGTRYRKARPPPDRKQEGGEKIPPNPEGQ